MNFIAKSAAVLAAAFALAVPSVASAHPEFVRGRGWVERGWVGPRVYERGWVAPRVYGPTYAPRVYAPPVYGPRVVGPRWVGPRWGGGVHYRR